MIKRIIDFIKLKIHNYKEKRAMNKRLKEDITHGDPFIYK